MIKNKQNSTKNNDSKFLWGAFFIFVELLTISNIKSAKKLISIAISTHNTFETIISISMFIMMLFLFCWTFVLNMKMFNFKK